MFEIGSSLRQARMRRGLELPDIERETHIRTKYLSALEDDRFEILPGPAYARGFLRTYADHLGLDAQRFVDEYDTRFAPEEQPAAPPPVRIQRPRFRPGGWILAAVLLLATISLLAWGLSGGHGHPAVVHRGPPETRVTTQAAPIVTAPTVSLPPAVARLVVVATRGPCWLSVHIGSAAGRSVYERTLEQGRSARFVSTRLWLRMGAPSNVDATLNGKRLQLPSATTTVVVTSAGAGGA